jgi:hypothetical protein
MPARKRDDSTCCLNVLVREAVAKTILTPLKMSYEAAKRRAEPYTRIVEELPDMRRETVHLVRQAVSEGRRAYVLVNN